MLSPVKKLLNKLRSGEPKQPPSQPTPTETKIIVYGSWSGLTLQQWLASDDRIAWFKKLWQDPSFQEVVTVLRNSAPRGFPIRGEKYTADQLAVELGRKEGYADALMILEAMMVFPDKPAPELEPNYLEEAPFVNQSKPLNQ